LDKILVFSCNFDKLRLCEWVRYVDAMQPIYTAVLNKTEMECPVYQRAESKFNHDDERDLFVFMNLPEANKVQYYQPFEKNLQQEFPVGSKNGVISYANIQNHAAATLVPKIPSSGFFSQDASFGRYYTGRPELNKGIKFMVITPPHEVVNNIHMAPHISKTIINPNWIECDEKFKDKEAIIKYLFDAQNQQDFKGGHRKFSKSNQIDLDIFATSLIEQKVYVYKLPNIEYGNLDEYDFCKLLLPENLKKCLREQQHIMINLGGKTYFNIFAAFVMDYESITDAVLTNLQHHHTRERDIILFKQLPESASLLKTVHLAPREGHFIELKHPKHVDPKNDEIIKASNFTFINRPAVQRINDDPEKFFARSFCKKYDVDVNVYSPEAVSNRIKELYQTQDIYADREQKVFNCKYPEDFIPKKTESKNEKEAMEHASAKIHQALESQGRYNIISFSQESNSETKHDNRKGKPKTTRVLRQKRASKKPQQKPKQKPQQKQKQNYTDEDNDTTDEDNKDDDDDDDDDPTLPELDITERQETKKPQKFRRPDRIVE
jgi:hypothetical protein